MKNALEELRKAYTKLFASPYAIFLFGFIILIIPYLFRGFVLHGQESYFYYRISSFIIENDIPNYDFLSFGGRAFFYSMGNFVFLVLLSLLFNTSVEVLLILIPFIFGIFSLILFYYILKHFKIGKNTLSVACYLLVFSPVFLYSFTNFVYSTIPLFLNLLGFFLIIQRKNLFYYLAFLVYLILPFFGFIHILFGLLLVFFYFYKFHLLRKFIPYSFIILLTLYINNNFINFGLDLIGYKFHQLFFAFGGEYGLSIFLVFLSFFGLMWLWKDKYKNTIYYIFFILNIFLLILSLKYIVYVNLMLCVFGSFGLRNIYRLKWNSVLIRNLTVILLIGGVVFSGVSFLTENSKTEPSNGLYKALEFMEKKTTPRDVIFSHEKYGSYINSISKRKNFIDFNYAYAPRLKLRLFYLNKIFYSRSLTDTLNIFNEFKINYILITPEMKSGLVWNKGSEGLYYLLKKNPDYFDLIYDENGYEIWRVL